MPPPSAIENTLLSAASHLRHNLSKSAAAASRTACSAAGVGSPGGRAAPSAAALGAGAGQLAAAAGAPQLLFTSSAAHGHALAGHVEQPARVDVILDKLRGAGITSGFDAQLHQLPTPPPAPLEAVSEVHSYVDELRRQADKAGREGMPAAVADIGDPDGVTYVTGSSFDDALQAAGNAMALVDAVVAASRAQQAQQAGQAGQAGQGQQAPAPPTPGNPAGLASASGSGSASGNLASGSSGVVAAGPGTAAISLSRPPGHHATADTPLGYCLFNNVALAARHAQRRHGLAKVLILDFDLHHGNGTQDIFSSDPSVLFIDTHEASSTYPCPPYADGGEADVGEGAGRGATINVPLPRYSGEACVLRVFDQLIAPAAERFCPDLILVSAGFDAHWLDPFQQLQFRSSTYHKLASRLRELAGRLCGGRLAFLLEGGYHTEAVGESVCEVFLALLGRPSVEARAEPALPQPEPVAEVEALVGRLRRIHGLQ